MKYYFLNSYIKNIYYLTLLYKDYNSSYRSASNIRICKKYKDINKVKDI